MAAEPNPPKLHGDFESARRSSSSVDVIVHFTTSPNEKLHALVARFGGELLHELTLIDSAAYRIPAKKLAQLAARPEVSDIALDQIVSTTPSSMSAAVLVRGD